MKYSCPYSQSCLRAPVKSFGLTWRLDEMKACEGCILFSIATLTGLSLHWAPLKRTELFLLNSIVVIRYQMVAYIEADIPHRQGAGP